MHDGAGPTDADELLAHNLAQDPGLVSGLAASRCKCGAHAVLAKQQTLRCAEALCKALLYYRVPGGAVTWLVLVLF